MRRVWGVAAVLAALVFFAPGRSARADQQTDDFKTHVQRAKVHYDLGEFDEAADEYIEAYRIKPIAGALFNIAQAYRQGGKYDKSRQFYRSYLREANPDGKTKAQVEKQIKELDELIAKEEKTKRSAPTGVQPSLAGKDELSPSGHDELAPPPSSTKASPAVALAPPSTGASAAAPAAAQGAPTVAQPPSARPQQGAPASSPSASQSAGAAPASSGAASAGTVAIVDPPRKPSPSTSPSPAQAAPAPAAAVRPDSSADSASSGGRSHTLAYVAAGAAVLLLGGGTLFGVEAARTDNELTAGAHARADADSLISTSKSDHTLSAVLLIAGAAAAVGAGLLYFLPTSGPSGGGGAAVGGHF